MAQRAGRRRLKHDDGENLKNSAEKSLLMLILCEKDDIFEKIARFSGQSRRRFRIVV
jgi:hypothetical protein